MRKYPRVFEEYVRKSSICPSCGMDTEIAIKKTFQTTWFRGEDETEFKPLCPVCDNWKTKCPICAKIMLVPKGLEMHINSKHKGGQHGRSCEI